jgi:hypothetical protein
LQKIEENFDKNNETLLSDSPNSKKIKDEYLETLRKQIQDKKIRDQEFERISNEQGKIWMEQDMKAKKEDFIKKMKKKETQRLLYEEYTRQVQRKNENKSKSGLLSPNEAELNKKVYESSIAILESSIS